MGPSTAAVELESSVALFAPSAPRVISAFSPFGTRDAAAAGGSGISPFWSDGGWIGSSAPAQVCSSFSGKYLGCVCSLDLNLSRVLGQQTLKKH